MLINDIFIIFSDWIWLVLKYILKQKPSATVLPWSQKILTYHQTIYLKAITLIILYITGIRIHLKPIPAWNNNLNISEHQSNISHLSNLCLIALEDSLQLPKTLVLVLKVSHIFLPKWLVNVDPVSVHINAAIFNRIQWLGFVILHSDLLLHSINVLGISLYPTYQIF